MYSASSKIERKKMTCEEVRKRVEEMKEKSRGSLVEDGSSVVSMKRLIEDLINGN